MTELLPVAQCTNETALALADAPRSLRNYVAALQAENEALREQLNWVVKENDRLLAEGSELTARAEQLAEALEQAVTSMQDSGYPNSHVAVRAARAALAKEYSHDNQ